MDSKDINDLKRVLDRNQANRVAKQNGGGGILGCGLVLLLVFGIVGTGLIDIIQHIV